MDPKDIKGVNVSSILDILQTMLIMGSSLAIGESLRDALVQTIRWMLKMETNSSDLGPGSTWIVFAVLVVICIPSILIMHCFIQRGQKYINLIQHKMNEQFEST